MESFAFSLSVLWACLTHASKIEIPTAMLQNSRTKGKRIIINIEIMANWATTSYRCEIYEKINYVCKFK